MNFILLEKVFVFPQTKLEEEIKPNSKINQMIRW